MTLLCGDERGRVYDLHALTPRDVQIEVLARRLAKINRCAGATPFPYSVATHSVLVSHLCPPDQAWAGLVHDLTEAFVGDMIGPIKREMGDFVIHEDYVREQLHELLGIPRWDSAEVHLADKRAFALEAKMLRGRFPDGTVKRRSWAEKRLCQRFLSREFTWDYSAFIFMARWRQLQPR